MNNQMTDYQGPPMKIRRQPVRLGLKWNVPVLTEAVDTLKKGNKAPTTILNDLGVRVVYRLLDMGGSTHCPQFTYTASVADMTFTGRGNSKREARSRAASACLVGMLVRAEKLSAAGLATQASSSASASFSTHGGASIPAEPSTQESPPALPFS